jgi:hypothetical protein
VCVRLPTLSPSVSRLSRQCEILNIPQSYRPPQLVTGIALLCFLLPLIKTRITVPYALYSSEALAPKQTPIQWLPGVSSPGTNRKRREAHHSSQSSARSIIMEL